MSKKPCVLACDTAAQVITVICSATDAVLDENEYELAQSVLADIETQCYTLPDAAYIVSEVEKAIGRGFADNAVNQAARGVAQVLGVQWLMPAPAEEHWQMLEPEYIADRWQARRAIAADNIQRHRRELETLRHSTHASNQLKAQSFELYIKHWQRDLDISEHACPDAWAKNFRARYVELVKKAISTGKPAPEAVIAQYPEFETAKTARARYEKGRHTSFAARSVAVDDTLLETHGFSVKRQDGKPLPEMQLAEVARGMAEISAAIGEVADILRARGLTIAHTNGKHPFLSQHAGQYNLTEKTISTGVSGLFGPIPSLAHEFAHWLDYAAGEVLGQSTRVYAKGNRRSSYPSSSLAEADCYRSLEGHLIQRARRSFYVSRYGIDKRLKLKGEALKALPASGRAAFEAQKFILGAYWYEPREVFARLFEQYVATALAAQAQGCAGQAAYALPLQSARALWSVYPDYTHSLAYWSADEWAVFGPPVAEEIQRRLRILRGGGE